MLKHFVYKNQYYASAIESGEWFFILFFFFSILFHFDFDLVRKETYFIIVDSKACTQIAKIDSSYKCMLNNWAIEIVK